MNKPTTGFVAFTLGERDVTLAPVYEGESPWGAQVVERAKRLLSFERVPVGVPGSNPFSERHIDESNRTFYKKSAGGGLQALEYPCM